ncbi:tryptophan-rich sensory protein [Candidatus Brachybacter algidus]|uniref:tryptophan-rich sensory protein n=1 Tax=Candidatus Brachybacter algidus TaxID=2982024 RepID=UPI00338D64D2
MTNGLILITSLTILIGVFLFGYYKELKAKVFFVLPYFIWLLIATSLNAYILLYN